MKRGVDVPEIVAGPARRGRGDVLRRQRERVPLRLSAHVERLDEQAAIGDSDHHRATAERLLPAGDDGAAQLLARVEPRAQVLVVHQAAACSAQSRYSR
jgi:hypothetical protein